MNLAIINKSAVETTRKIFALTCIVFCISMASINLIGAFATQDLTDTRSALVNDDLIAELEKGADEVLVTLQNLEQKEVVAQHLSADSDHLVQDPYNSLPILILSNVSVNDVASIASRKEVVSIEPNRKAEVLASPQIQRIQAENVKSQESNSQLNGEGVNIGFIDNGINADRVSFKDKSGKSRVKSLGCFEAQNVAFPCLTNPEQSGEAVCPAEDILKSDCFHGGAVADNAAGNRRTLRTADGRIFDFGGVAFGANILSTRLAGDADGIFDMSMILGGLDRYLTEIENNTSLAPDVLNISIGFDVPSNMCNLPSAVKSTLDEIVNRGVTIVAATGNDGDRSKILFPACIQSVISVSATEFEVNQNGEIVKEKIANFSNINNQVDLVAPGSNILALTADEENIIAIEGTSFAAPYVSGAVALMLEENPGLTPARIRQLLASTSDVVSDEQSSATYRRLNVQNAVSSLSENSEQETTTTVATQPTSSSPISTQPTTSQPITVPSTNPGTDQPTDSTTIPETGGESQPQITEPANTSTQNNSNQNEVSVGGEDVTRNSNSLAGTSELPHTGSTSNQIVFAGIWMVVAGLMMMLFKQGMSRNQLLRAKVK